MALYFAVGCSRRDRMVYMYVKLIVCLSACQRVYVYIFQETSTVYWVIFVGANFRMIELLILIFTG